MNLLSNPPMREPLAAIEEGNQFGKYEIGDTPAVWRQWLSDLLKVVNDMQATGTTTQRPNPAPFIGFMYFDTTIGKPIWAVTGTTWVKADGTAA